MSILESTNLICLSRGGLFVGGLVSYALNMKKVYNISVESYEEDSMDSNVEVKLLTPFPVLDPSQKYLVVDDLNDTSETYRFISRQMIKYDCPDWNFATVYHKQRKGNDVPDFYGTLMPADSWIVFPWDRLR